MVATRNIFCVAVDRKSLGYNPTCENTLHQTSRYHQPSTQPSKVAFWASMLYLIAHFPSKHFFSVWLRIPTMSYYYKGLSSPVPLGQTIPHGPTHYSVGAKIVELKCRIEQKSWIGWIHTCRSICISW